MHSCVNEAEPVLVSQEKKRAILNEQQVREIFRLKPSSNKHSNNHDRGNSGKSSLVSKKYRISPKAVRDVWNFRTWRHITLTMIDCAEILDQNATSATSALSRPSEKIMGDAIDVNPGSPLTTRPFSDTFLHPQVIPHFSRSSGSKLKQSRKKSDAGQQRATHPHFQNELDAKSTFSKPFHCSENHDIPISKLENLQTPHADWSSSVQVAQTAADQQALLFRTYPFFLSI